MTRRIALTSLPIAKLSSEWSPHISLFVLFVTRYKFWESAFLNSVQVTNACNHHFSAYWIHDCFRIPIPIFHIFKLIHLVRFQHFIVYVLKLVTNISISHESFLCIDTLIFCILFFLTYRFNVLFIITLYYAKQQIIFLGFVAVLRSRWTFNFYKSRFQRNC